MSTTHNKSTIPQSNISQIKLDKVEMIVSMPTSPRNTRYANTSLNSLVKQLNNLSSAREQQASRQIRKSRILNHSLSVKAERASVQGRGRPSFNNKNKEGQLLDPTCKSVPYVFIPKFKNQTFIMPDRVFAKGKAGKRFHIKMKDSSIYSFKDAESERVRESLKKQEKDHTIVSRQLEEFHRIIDDNDGCIKATQNKWYLKNRKKFHPTSTSSELFSMIEPMLMPKDKQSVQLKKIGLAKTFDHAKKWRPNSRGTHIFSQSANNSFYEHAARTSASDLKSEFKSTKTYEIKSIK